MSDYRKLNYAEFEQHIEQDFGRRITEIIIHHSWRPTAAQYAGERTIAGILHYHRNVRGWSTIGYNVIIGPNADIFLCRPIRRSGGHTLDHNAQSVGICHIGDFDAEDPWQYAGYEQGIDVVAALCLRFALSEQDVYFHRDFANKSCPGTQFDRAEYREAVQQAMNNPIGEPDVYEWAQAYVDRAKDLGILIGRPDGTFGGREPLTRQEAAVALVRLYDRIILNSHTERPQ